MKGAGRGAQLAGRLGGSSQGGSPGWTGGLSPDDGGLGWGLSHWAWGQWRQGGLHMVFLLG